MAAALTGLAFYFIQDKKDGRIIFFNGKGYVNKMKRSVNRRRRGGQIALHGDADEDTEEHAKILMNYKTAMSSFLIGMEKIFGACIVLTLAWATGKTDFPTKTELARENHAPKLELISNLSFSLHLS